MNQLKAGYIYVWGYGYPMVSSATWFTCSKTCSLLSVLGPALYHIAIGKHKAEGEPKPNKSQKLARIMPHTLNEPSMSGLIGEYSLELSGHSHIHWLSPRYCIKDIEGCQDPAQCYVGQVFQRHSGDLWNIWLCTLDKTSRAGTIKAWVWWNGSAAPPGIHQGIWCTTLRISNGRWW